MKQFEIQSYSSKTKNWLACQQSVNYLLSALVNGESSFSRRRAQDWAYRFLYANPTWWRASAPPALSRFSPKGSGRASDGALDCRDVYDLLKECEGFLNIPPSDVPVKLFRYTVDDAGNHSDHPIIPTIRSVLRPLDGSVSAYIHGSVALGDYTAFSDVDDFLVLHRSMWDSFSGFKLAIRHLERVSQLFQRTDPLQHHGHWVFTDFDLMCLEQSRMPLVVLPGAVTVAGSATIEARVRDDSDPGRVLESIVQDIKQGLSTLTNSKINLIALKDLISSISLAPALVFQARGDWFEKKLAIRKSEEIFSAEALRAIKWATNIRVYWSSCPGYQWVRVMRAVNRVLPFRRNALEKIARRASPCLTKEQIPFFSDQVLRGLMALVKECSEPLDTLPVTK